MHRGGANAILRRCVMLIIGEKINASGRRVREAIRKRDKPFLQRVATEQVAAGADYLDVNAGMGQGSEQEAEDMEWLIAVVQEVMDKPLAIDSADPRVIEAGLRRYRGPSVIINSINAEDEKLKALLPLVAEHRAQVIALAMDERGIPSEVEGRIKACARILERASSYRIPQERIFFDPLALPIAVDTREGMITLKTLEQIKSRYPEAKTTLGLSNVSYGLPLRGVINRALLLMALYMGLDSVIMDPLDSKLMAYIKGAEVILGQDPFCKEYLKSYRKGILVE